MQTPQTNQTIKQFTPKTKILIFMKTGLLQYNTTNKGSRPEIQDDPGERGRGKEESRQSSTPPTRGSAPCRTRTFRRETFCRETVRSKNETTSVKRKNDNSKRRSREAFSLELLRYWAGGLKSTDDQEVHPE